VLRRRGDSVRAIDWCEDHPIKFAVVLSVLFTVIVLICLVVFG